MKFIFKASKVFLKYGPIFIYAFTHFILNFYSMKLFSEKISRPGNAGGGLLSLLLLSALATAPVRSQTNLFTAMSYGQLNLSPQEDAYRLKVEAYPRVGAARYFAMANLSAALSDGELSFSLPGFSTSLYKAHSIYFDHDAAGAYGWAGKIAGAGHGDIVLAYTPQGISGNISLSTQTFAIYPLGGQKVVVIETGPDNVQCGTDMNNETLLVDWCETDYETCPAVIDILCVSTEAAYDFSKFSQLKLAETNTNVALQNSQIFNKRVRVRYVVGEFAANFSNIMQNDIEMLENNAAFQNLRDIYRADIIFMLNEQFYQGPQGGQIFGAVPGEAQEINPDFAFGIIHYNFLNAPRFTFAHETAHLLGARHNRPDPLNPLLGGDQSFDCSFGMIFNDVAGVQRRTIMAALGTGQQRILHFSNPDVDFNGAPTGTNGNGWTAHNNARKMRNTGCAVANFRPDAWLNVQVWEYDNHHCHYIRQVNEPAPGFPGGAPYTTEWRLRSGNPFFTGAEAIIGTDVDVFLSPSTQIRWLQVKVTAADGTVATDVYTLPASGCGTGTRPGPQTNAIPTTEALAPDFSLAPNPAGGSLVMQFKNTPESSFQVVVAGMSGQVLLRQTVELSALPEAKLPLDTHHFLPGAYRVCVRYRDRQITKKLIIQNP